MDVRDLLKEPLEFMDSEGRQSRAVLNSRTTCGYVTQLFLGGKYAGAHTVYDASDAALHQALVDRALSRQREQYEPVIRALEKYKHCRHGQVDCFCVKEARAALATLSESQPTKERIDG